ncbi:serine/threonine protein kinase Nek6, putative [Entamoeba invadens IP1]|uniref:Serine/threonine protein kinase Nek6, putative n=1 Tax=Entamoeba invadens IP1 TaxID=370355 RepID=A0A0A1TYV6_ENTIV|nr:serine/threonine protein kinase Nek6, putative [Entamoeba invadens IP1]ELP86694.1 serine/threonine protein kinase Nek6, putative [Entamoeba invadens IP1]|eukprot:XP_004186040.1 serine/threonine protein kinase Nek6, putative [Entamoeba invadens IP1]
MKIQNVVLKLIKPCVIESTFLDDVLKEVTLIQSFRHINIMSIIGVVPYEDTVGIVMELAACDLEKYIYLQLPKVLETIDHSTFGKLNIFLQCCKGIQWVHDKFNIAHNNLKPTNFLLTPNGVIKISDFNLAREGKSDIKSCEGTPLYSAPETFEKDGKTHGKEVDVYSMGVVLWEMLYEKKPFNEYYNSSMGAINFYAAI